MWSLLLQYRREISSANCARAVHDKYGAQGLELIPGLAGKNWCNGRIEFSRTISYTEKYEMEYEVRKESADTF